MMAHKRGRKNFRIFDLLRDLLRLILSKGAAQVNILRSGLNLRPNLIYVASNLAPFWGKAAGKFRP